MRQHSDKLATCLDRLTASLSEQLPDMGRDVAIDSSDLPGYANGQRFLFKNGPERERFSDPDAAWGHRSAASTRKGGGFYGYKLHAAVCAVTGLPLAWRIESANHGDALFALPLLDAVRDRGFAPQTCAMDKGYDSRAIHDGCEERYTHPIIAQIRARNAATQDDVPTCDDGAGRSRERTSSARRPSGAAPRASASPRQRGSRPTGCTH